MSRQNHSFAETPPGVSDGLHVNAPADRYLRDERLPAGDTSQRLMELVIPRLFDRVDLDYLIRLAKAQAAQPSVAEQYQVPTFTIPQQGNPHYANAGHIDLYAQEQGMAPYLGSTVMPQRPEDYSSAN